MLETYLPIVPIPYDMNKVNKNNKNKFKGLFFRCQNKIISAANVIIHDIKNSH